MTPKFPQLFMSTLLTLQILTSLNNPLAGSPNLRQNFTPHTARSSILCSLALLILHSEPDIMTRLRNDHNAISSTLGVLDQSLSSVHVRDCIHLGKFNKSQVHLRPIVVKFNSFNFLRSLLTLSPSIVTFRRRNITLNPCY